MQDAGATEDPPQPCHEVAVFSSLIKSFFSSSLSPLHLSPTRAP